MNISLVGLTLHVPDVDHSLNFYKQLPDRSILFHMPGKFALLKVGSWRLGLLQDQKRSFHVEIDCQDLDATCVLLKESGFQLILSGLWMWKGHVLRRLISKRSA